MIERSAYLAKRPFQDAKIDEHAATVEGFAPGMGEHPVIMPVKPLAFPVKIGKKMGGGKVCFYSRFVHGLKHSESNPLWQSQRCGPYCKRMPALIQSRP
jgi:hypothetical protein